MPCKCSHAARFRAFVSSSVPHRITVRATEDSTPFLPNRIGFPYESVADLTGLPGCADVEQMIEMLSPMMMDGRLERIQRIVSQRTFSVLPIVEGIYNMGESPGIIASRC